MIDKWEYMSFNFKRHIYTSDNSFICRLIFNAHIDVTYRETICRLLPTTSHHTVQGYHPSHVYRRRTFSTLNQSTWRYAYAHFQWSYYSETFTCVTHSKSETLQGPGVPCHNIPYQVDDGPLCRRMMPARRVTCDNFVSFKFIIFMCIFFYHHTHQWWFFIMSHPATTVDGKFWRGGLRKAFMRSGDMARAAADQ